MIIMTYFNNCSAVFPNMYPPYDKNKNPNSSAGSLTWKHGKPEIVSFEAVSPFDVAEAPVRNVLQIRRIKISQIKLNNIHVLLDAIPILIDSIHHEL